MKLGLGMIMRNEEVDLIKSLNTFLPHVDFACVLDTGSTDKSMEIAEQILKLHKKEYVLMKYLDASDSDGKLEDFSKARNKYIDILEASGMDYIVSADADDIYMSSFGPKEYIEKNPAEIYAFKYWLNQQRFFMSFKLWKTGLGIKYVGRVHECISFDWKYKIKNSEIEIMHHVEHHEGQEHGTVRNMRILRNEIYPNLRSVFYWANENADAQNYKEAIKWYLEYIRRAKEGEKCWITELHHCYFRAARWLQHIGDIHLSDVLSHELLCQDDTWAEAWCQLAYNARLRNNIPLMVKYAKKALEQKFVSRLFSESDKYDATPKALLKYADTFSKLSIAK